MNVQNMKVTWMIYTVGMLLWLVLIMIDTAV